MAISIVQHARGGPTGGSTSLPVTLGSPTTAGNCLIVAAGATAGTAGITGITLGGAADNWHSDAHVRNTGGAVAVDADIWSDPNCAGGQTAIVISYPTTGSHSACDVWEVSGLAATLPADKSASNAPAAATTFDSLATAATSQAAEFWAGVVVDLSAATGNPVLTGPSVPWANQAQVNIGSLGSYIAGEQITSSPGAAEYSGTIDRSSFYAAAVVTYKGASVAHTATGALAVTPAFSASRTRGRFRTGALTVTPSMSASRARGKFRTGSLTVVPVLAATRMCAHVRSAVLNLAPRFTAQPSGGSSPAAPAHTGSWYQLLDILKQADEEFDFYASRPPMACPRCGEPLRDSPTSDSGSSVELYCRFDGWSYPRDYVRPVRT